MGSRYHMRGDMVEMLLASFHRTTIVPVRIVLLLFHKIKINFKNCTSGLIQIEIIYMHEKFAVRAYSNTRTPPILTYSNIFKDLIRLTPIA